MTKKGQNKGKKPNHSVNVAGAKQRTAQGRVYSQVHPDQAKRRKHHKRVEFVLNPAYDEDRKMIALLDDLQGGKSDYIREAVAQKIDYDQRGDPFMQLEAMIAELAETRAMVQQQFEALIRAQAVIGSLVERIPATPYFDAGFNGLRADIQDLRDNPPQVNVQLLQAANVTTGVLTPTLAENAKVQFPPTLPEQGAVVSSGIDLSRPRPRPKLQPGAVVAPAPEADAPMTEAESIRLAQVMAASIAAYNGGKT